MKIDLRSTFADVYRRVPGRYDRLQHALTTDDGLAAEEFRRLIRAYEDELNRLERRAKFSLYP